MMYTIIREDYHAGKFGKSSFDYLVSRTYINSYFESKYTGLEEIVDFHLVESESTFFPYCSDLVIMIPAGFFLKRDNMKQKPSLNKVNNFVQLNSLKTRPSIAIIVIDRVSGHFTRFI